jgi:spore coat protein U domain-containing protein, fimbrial subunit CupE1/2/3/6
MAMNYSIIILCLVFLSCLPVECFAFVCYVTSTPVNFNTYDVFSPIPSDSTGSLTLNCNNPDKKPLPVTIAISSGNAGIFTPRQMRQTTGPDRMNYNLFIDPSRTTIWGDGTGSTSIVTEVVTRDFILNEVIYGRVPAQQNLSVGTYSDILTVTVSW